MEKKTVMDAAEEPRHVLASDDGRKARLCRTSLERDDSTTHTHTKEENADEDVRTNKLNAFSLTFFSHPNPPHPSPPVL